MKIAEEVKIAKEVEIVKEVKKDKEVEIVKEVKIVMACDVSPVVMFWSNILRPWSAQQNQGSSLLRGVGSMTLVRSHKITKIKTGI